MSIHRFFRRRFPLRSRARELAFLCFILFISGCGEETIDNPLGGGVNEEGKTENVVPISTPYYPMTLGSRWVYRNPDGSEWTREVAETEVVNRRKLRLFFIDNPLLEGVAEAKQLVFVKAPSYIVTSDQIVHPISLTELRRRLGTTIDIPYKISKTVHGIFNGIDLNTRYQFVGSRSYKIHELRHREFVFLASPLVPGAAWNALDLRFSLEHTLTPQWFFHSLDAHLEIWAKIGADRASIVTPAGTFEDCLEIQYYLTRFQIETTELKLPNLGGPRAAEFPKVWREIRKYVETEIPKTAETEIRNAVPHFQSASLWLAPDVGPVRIETPNGISELIDYEVKAVASD